MHFVRSAVVFILSTLLPSLLIATVLSAVVWRIFGSRDRLTETIESSGIYETYLPIFEETKQNQVTDADVPVDEAARREITQKAFSPEFRRAQVATFVNGTYDWLEGKVDKPAFTMEFSALKTNLANALAEYGEERVAGLPVCPSNSQSSEVDAFRITCRPPNLSATAVGEQIRQDFVSSEDFLQDTSVEASEISKDEEGRSAFDRLSELPRVFDALRASQILLPIIVALVLAGIVLISNDRLRSLRRVGLILLVIGSLLVLTSFFTRTGMEQVRSAALRQQTDARGKAYASAIVDVFEALATRASGVGRLYGASFAVAGIAGLLSAMHLQNRRAHTLPKTEHQPAAAPSEPKHDVDPPKPATESEKPTTPPKKPRPPRLVQ